MRLRGVLLGFVLFALVAIATGCVVLVVNPQAPAPASQAPETPLSVVVVPTVVIVSSPTPLPDRTDCSEIRGSEYRSESEHQWFLDNCMAPPAPAVAPAAPPAIPGAEVQGERWVLVDIATQTATAMIGGTRLYTALVTTGKDGWNTPKGTWQIQYRVENETMTSQSIGAEEYYVLKDVLYTQYFTGVGHALHTNYWQPASVFGSTPTSHGCVGMRLADAEFFWRFAKSGTRVTIQ